MNDQQTLLKQIEAERELHHSEINKLMRQMRKAEHSAWRNRTFRRLAWAAFRLWHPKQGAVALLTALAADLQRYEYHSAAGAPVYDIGYSFGYTHAIRFATHKLATVAHLLGTNASDDHDKRIAALEAELARATSQLIAATLAAGVNENEETDLVKVIKQLKGNAK